MIFKSMAQGHQKRPPRSFDAPHSNGNYEQGDRRRQADSVREEARATFLGFDAVTLPSFAAAR